MKSNLFHVQKARKYMTKRMKQVGRGWHFFAHKYKEDMTCSSTQGARWTICHGYRTYISGAYGLQ